MWILLPLACAALAPGATPRLPRPQEPRDQARALVRLADVPERDGVKSGELRLVAEQAGTLVAWIDGEGASVALLALDAAGNELASDESELRGKPARIELAAAAGAAYAIAWEARGAKPWGWLRAHARVAVESELTRSAPARARDALREARGCADTGDAEAERARLEGAIGELLSLPGASGSRAVADALWTLVFPAFSCGGLESALAAACAVEETRARFEPAVSKLVQSPRIGVGIVLSELRRVDEAVRSGLEVEALYARALSADDPELAKVRLNLANYLRGCGELERPAQLIADALAVYECRLPPESDERQRAVGIAAELDLAQGRREQAATRLRELYRAALASEDELNIAAVGGNYAIALTASGELELARRIEEDNLRRAERRLPPAHPALRHMRENLAVTLYSLGDLPRARALFELVLESYASEADPDRIGALGAYTNLAELERQSGDYPRARELYERALELAAEVEDENAAAMPLNGLAQTMLVSGDAEGAQRILEQLVSLRASTLGERSLYTQSARLALSECLQARGELARALELGELATQRMQALLPASDPHVYAARLLGLRTRQLAGEVESARSGLIQWERDLARQLARESLDGSSRVVEERAFSWRNRVAAALGLSLRLSADPGLASAGLELLETLRASSLWAADALRAAGESPAAAGAREGIARLSRELARASVDQSPDAALLSRLTAEKDELERRLLSGMAQRSAATGWGEPLRLEPVRAALHASEAALSYTSVAGPGGSLTLPSHAAVFVLRAAAPVALVDLGEERAVAAAVLAWRTALGTEGAPARSPEEQRATGEALRRLVFDPLRAQLAGVTRVFVAQDGALNLISLDALPDGAGILGDSVAVRCVPTLAVLASPAEPRASARPVVLIGGLDYGAGRLPRLSGAGEEVDRIADVYRAAHREVLVLHGREADPERFAAALAGAGILHVATHAELAGEVASSDFVARGPAGRESAWSAVQAVRELSPLSLCGLALSGANEQSPDGGRAGFLRGVELAAMDARGCRLAVLSACSTRAGVERPGLAVASLEKAMHMAGARAVLASLWQVDDVQGRELMLEFHRGLVERELSPADALWSAKSLLRSRRAPARAWAGWILSSVDAGGQR